MSRDPAPVALSMVITGVLFLVILLNRGGKWKSRTKRRLGLLACSFAMLAAAVLLVRDIALLPGDRLDGLLTLVGVLAFFTTMALAVVTMVFPNEPEES